jgi:Berberine and berberine like
MDFVKPDDARYDDARRVFNGLIYKRPAVIAECETPGDQKYGRLAEIKAEWDPTNLFRGNQNIEPA